jgi:hypothetical protein
MITYLLCVPSNVTLALATTLPHGSHLLNLQASSHINKMNIFNVYRIVVAYFQYFLNKEYRIKRKLTSPTLRHSCEN